MVIAVVPTWAQAVNFSGGVSITEMTPQSGIFSHIDMAYKSRIIGSWFSTAGYLPVLVKSENLTYTAYGDFVGIPNGKVEQAVLTPDGGKTQWPATLVPGKGWQVQIPFGTHTDTVQTVKDVKVRGNKTEKVVCEETQTVIGLESGGYALEWGVVSRDKRNRVMIIIIPINYTSSRTSNSANHVMVQREVANIAVLNDAAISIYLREHGFQPAVDTFSPAVMAAQQMYQPKPSTPPAPAAQPAQPVQPVQPTKADPQANQSDGTIRAEVTAPVQPTPEPVRIKLKIYLWPLHATKPVPWDATVDQAWYNALTKKCQTVVLTRGGKKIAVGEAQAGYGIIEIHFDSTIVPEPSDNIETIKEVN